MGYRGERRQHPPLRRPARRAGRRPSNAGRAVLKAVLEDRPQVSDIAGRKRQAAPLARRAPQAESNQRRAEIAHAQPEIAPDVRHPAPGARRGGGFGGPPASAPFPRVGGARLPGRMGHSRFLRAPAGAKAGAPASVCPTTRPVERAGGAGLPSGPAILGAENAFGGDRGGAVKPRLCDWRSGREAVARQARALWGTNSARV